MSDYSLRFGGIERLYGAQASRDIQQAHICVIGIGGVGSWAAEALARNGIGQITLIDLDDICVTNTNRQIHALADTIGESKVEVMANRLRQINPDCQVNEVDDFVTEDNLRQLLSNNYDYVIDAIDSVPIKTAIIQFCKRNKIPVITIGGAGGQTDPTKIDICDLSKTYQDPLLAKVKNQLRRQFNFPRDAKRKFAIDAVFSSEQLKYPAQDGSVCHSKQSQHGSMRLDCNMGFGAATHVTASFAFVAVARVMEKYLARKQRQRANQ
ncbi:tRNA cyclic N6-threonylcarbamoyladenosine(37) synthase TcdA [Thalassotalea ponticola]|uniref:tRNA cyclic N6-threonylcarbamoyladenosine(37) synthase TcdA n=1 Tax=Thalassotalea ponticola TaxID=1523392 RepID=UPI0025B5CA01|nr:tRNA cyclic N6-threonylcarbamoyladenosine(37) synthase TcdA [Thalassotalea ponticola]MDN3651254.1 tRNA cyclic N6-threonylcarbamoyladenosine(37) synthase TcdA [Thalassotalea ponticola]